MAAGTYAWRCQMSGSPTVTSKSVRTTGGGNAAFPRMFAVAPLQPSELDVPIKQYQTYMAGAKVERMFPFGPLPGVAVMAAMVSHAGTCCFGLNIDGAAVADVEALLECFQAGLEETLAIGDASG